MTPFPRRCLASVFRGALGGALVTLTVGALLQAAQASGLIRVPTPDRDPEHAAEAAGGPHHEDDEEHRLEAAPVPLGVRAGWLTAQVVYGTAVGAAFAPLRQATPGPLLGALGPAFGLLLWAASARGPLPPLRLDVRPGDTSARGVATAVAAHVAFGAALAAFDGLLTRRGPSAHRAAG